jgi:PAS domain S-box-containing protein
VDGEVRWMHIKAEMIFDGGERPVRAVGMTQDITEVRLAQHALVAHQEQLEHLVQVRTAELANANFKLIAQTERLADLYDNAPCGYHSLHADGTFMTINDTELRWLGYRRDEVVGRMNIQEIMSPPTLLVFEERMRQLQRHGQLQGLESEYRRKDGSYLPVMINITSVRDADGAITQIRVTVFDISDRKAAELARARALQEAERLARVRSDFLANMSHEIRTPLNAVLGLAQVGMHGSPGPAAETFSRILNSGEVLLGVVNDVLDFSKIEAGRLELEHVHFGLGECIDRAVDITAGPAFAKDLDFRLDEAADLPVSCRGDALRLAQVLINLLSNAVKFTERGGVSLAVRRAAGELSFAVTDTGIGMSEEQVGRLFQPFEQADTSTTRRFGGSGLGLAISKRLVEMMHGRLEVTSKPGAGSTFTVHIPLADPVERDALQHAGMALAGLADAEAGPLLADLQRRGVPGQVCTLAEALRSDAHGIVVDVAVVRDGVNARAVLDAVGSRAIAIACKPGENGFLEELHNRVPLCQRPLSARRVLAACRAGVPAHEHPRKGQRLDGVRILAAEDNEMNQVVLEEMLLAEGAALTVVDNGRLALERLRASRGADFDILVTDIQMPEMDGYETARSARTLAPGLPVIGLTAHAMPEERQRCLDAGMVDHVTKPVLQETLVAAILRHRRRAGPAAPEALAHPAPKPQPATLIDWSAMESRFSGKRAFVDRLASTALRTYADYPADLRKAAAASDFKAIGFIAHGMRGTAWSLSANGLRELSARTEDAAKKATPETLVLARELAVAIEQLLAELAQRQAQTVA